ncbi:MAG: hypothetical protein BWY79_01843 [Actinobacteria bacterium ADurb.Bin444]|nr:MAG: hypothetical protein BWY79_01843 [Actinobacteria bacterium ADurb.Bin444]
MHRGTGRVPRVDRGRVIWCHMEVPAMEKKVEYEYLVQAWHPVMLVSGNAATGETTDLARFAC